MENNIELKLIAEKNLREMFRKLLASRDEGKSEEEKNSSFELAKAKYHGMGDMVCALGILQPREIDLISQHESKEWIQRQKEEEMREKPAIECFLDGLHTGLVRFLDFDIADRDTEVAVCGSWKIFMENPPFSNSIQISYDNVPVASIVPGKIGEPDWIKRVANLSDKNFTDFCDIVCSVMPGCRMAPEEQPQICSHMSHCR